MTKATDAIEADSAATRAEVIAEALVDLPPDSEEAVLAELRLEWADRHQASVVEVLVDLREALAAVASVVPPVVLGDLRAVSLAVTEKAVSAQ